MSEEYDEWYDKEHGAMPKFVLGKGIDVPEETVERTEESVKKDLDLYFEALGQKESSGNPKARNVKENALGLYQIRPAFWSDGVGQLVKEGLDEAKTWKHEVDAFDPEKARLVTMGYMKRYIPSRLRALDFIGMARTHNGGPKGAKRRSTDKYGRDFDVILKGLRDGQKTEN